jgi:hypothetical protein
MAMMLLAIAGHVCAVQLVDVPRYAAYQHYRPWTWIVTGHSLAVGGVAAQAMVTLAAAWRLRSELSVVLRALLTHRSWMATGALLLASLAVPSGTLAFSVEELSIAGIITMLTVLNLGVGAAMVPGRIVDRAAEWAEARVTLDPNAASAGRWDRALPVAVAIWVTAMAAAMNVVVLERMPHIDDSVSNLFQAKYFAQGRLFLPAPPDTASFQVDQTVVDSGKWYGYAFPGWPAVLAVGVLAGMPWIVNPLLGGITILLGHAFIRRRLDRATANTAVLMLAVSPWLIFMSAEFMPHPLTAVLALIALVAFDRTRGREPRWLLWAVVAGAAIGGLALTRAIEAALVTAAIVISAVIEGGFRRLLPPLLPAMAIAAAFAALMPVYSLAVTGRADYPPHLAWSDGRWGPGVDRLGFGPNIGISAWPNLDPLPGHGPIDVVLNTNKNLFMVNADLFGWATGSLVFVALALGIGRWRRADTLLLALTAAYIAGHSFYWFSGGPDIGARYWYPLLVPLAALTARGAQMAVEQLRKSDACGAPGARVGVVILVACVSAGVVALPWRAATKYYEYRGITSEVRALAEAHRFEHALVFIRSGDRADYQSAFSLNPPSLEGTGTVYAWDAGAAARARVVAAFPDRPVWVIERRPPGPEGEGPFVLTAGPLPPGTVPQ